jgi:protein O-mannosyl-transferase
VAIISYHFHRPNPSHKAQGGAGSSGACGASFSKSMALQLLVERIHPVWHARLQGVLLLVLGCGAAWPAIHGGYILDDDIYVTHNADLRSAEGLYRIWFKMGAEPDYYPLVHTTFWLEYRLWGTEPLGYHATNIALHGLCALLLWRLLLALRLPGAWFAAALFAVHPICVETTAWVTELKNTLSLLLALSSLLLYLRFERAEELSTRSAMARRRWGCYALALVMFLAALLAKSAVVALPAVLLTIYCWKRGRITWRRAAPLTPFVLLSMAMAIVTIWHEKYLEGARGADWSFTPLERVLIAGRAVWFYLGKLVWPASLSFIYPRWDVNQGQGLQLLFPLAVVVALATLWLVRRKIGRGPVACGLIYVGTLLPVLGLFDACYMRYCFVADHLQYHASVAMFAMLGCLAATIFQRLTLFRAIIGGASGLIVLGTLAFLSWKQSALYIDAKTLYRDTIAKNPDAWLAHHGLGIALADAGCYQEAITEHQTALRLKPLFPEAENDLGCALQSVGNMSEAILHFQKALCLKPDYPEVHNNLGNLYRQSGRLNDAVDEYQTALKINQNSFEAHNNLGVVLLECGRVHMAIAHCQVAVQLQPESAEAHNNYGNALLTAGQVPDAIEQYQQALSLKAKYVEADLNLAIAYARNHRLENAESSAHEAMAWAQAAGQTLLTQKIDLWLKSLRANVADRRVANPAAGSSTIR